MAAAHKLNEVILCKALARKSSYFGGHAAHASAALKAQVDFFLMSYVYHRVTIGREGVMGA